MKLLLCLIVDLIGIGTYAVPGIGEFGDIAWAPIQMVLVKIINGGDWSKLSFWEEVLPMTDIVPSATINYFQNM